MVDKSYTVVIMRAHRITQHLGRKQMIKFRKKATAAAVVAQTALVMMFVAAVPASAGHHESGDYHSMKKNPDIVDVAVAAGDFSTLAAALQAAGLVDTLKGDGPFTVFAPTDEAFAKLPAGTVEMLLKPENKDQLIAILTYHVVPGQSDCRAGRRAEERQDGQR
jgi:uncharacterized surface protein with fasciclin (FAS1) repeats